MTLKNDDWKNKPNEQGNTYNGCQGCKYRLADPEPCEGCFNHGLFKDNRPDVDLYDPVLSTDLYEF